MGWSAQSHEWEDLLSKWIDLLLQIANTPADQQKLPTIHVRISSALEDVIQGGHGFGAYAPQFPADLALPAMKVRVLHRRTELVADVPRCSALKPSDAAELSGIANQLHAVVMLLAHHPYARRLRRCDWMKCRAFFFATRDHRREHSFCCEEHRREFDLSSRDPKKRREYMKTWRAEQRRRQQRGAKRNEPTTK
jgi:hypothetical protein